ncbi:M20 metallopeptidase family protein [Aeromonas caviae]
MNHYHIEPDLLALRDFSYEVRHHLHRIPEYSGAEFKTSAYCRGLMEEFGYRITLYPGFTGFHGDLAVDPALPTIAFRADMDGLEMHDMSEVAFKSTHEGMAHNCGHDSHMAIALTAARFLAANRDRLRYNVRFIFQMAEEDMRVPGAEKMVELGCMKGVDEVYALHNDGAMETGTIKFNQGVMSSWGSAWTLDVHGISAHGSTPHKGLDAIREAVRIIEDMDYIVAKRTSPFSPAVFGCGMINGGTIPNAIADHVQARGTIRAMDAETDQILKNSFRDIIAQSELRGFKTTMVHAGYPAVENPPPGLRAPATSRLECVVQRRDQRKGPAHDRQRGLQLHDQRHAKPHGGHVLPRQRQSGQGDLQLPAREPLLPGRRLPAGGSPDLRQSGDPSRLRDQYKGIAMQREADGLSFLCLGVRARAESQTGRAFPG